MLLFAQKNIKLHLTRIIHYCNRKDEGPVLGANCVLLAPNTVPH